MCGIVGALNYDNAVSIAERMLQKISYRGPDFSGVTLVNNGSSAIGMCQLQVRAQYGTVEYIPFWVEDYKIAYNGEIYENYLRTGQEEARFMLEALKKEININGMVACCVGSIDGSDTYLYRDNMGIKPVFYHIDDTNRLLFSSELHSLVNSDCVEKKVDADALAEMMCFGQALNNKTIYKGLHALGPSEVIHMSKLGVDVHSITENMISLTSDASLKELLKGSLKKCLVSNRKIGLALSKGIDSTLLAFMLNELEIDDVEVICINVDINDSPASLNELGLPAGGAWTKWKYTVVNYTESVFKYIFEKSILTYDSPSYMTSIPLYYVLARTAAELGVVVLLTGEGADELFAGYNSYNTIDWSNDNICREYLDNVLFPERKKEMIYTLTNKENVMSAEKRFMKCYSNKGKDTFHIFRMMERNMSLQPLLKRTDHCMMRFGVEGRTPFLHGGVPEYSEQIIRTELLKNKHTKYVLRKLLSTEYDYNFAFEKKTAFRSPIIEWFPGSLKSWVHEKIEGDMSIFRNIGLDLNGVRQVLLYSDAGDASAVAVCYFLLTLGTYMNTGGD